MKPGNGGTSLLLMVGCGTGRGDSIIYIYIYIYSIFLKVFQTYDKDCITDIQIGIRQLPISMDIDTRKMKYISKLKLSKKDFNSIV